MRQHNNHKTLIFVMISLVLISKLLLGIDNMIVQSVGILLLPFIVISILKLMISDQKREI